MRAVFVDINAVNGGRKTIASDIPSLVYHVNGLSSVMQFPGHSAAI
jgi:hypothetical protein